MIVLVSMLGVFGCNVLSTAWGLIGKNHAVPEQTLWAKDMIIKTELEICTLINLPFPDIGQLNCYTLYDTVPVQSRAVKEEKQLTPTPCFFFPLLLPLALFNGK